MIEGSCLCGGVRYQYDGAFGPVTVCHCATCRKAQGTSNAIAAPADARQLRWSGDPALIAEYESSPGKQRAFCRRCGTPLYSRRDDAPQLLRLRMGTIDSEIDVVPVAHIFATGVPPWAALEDSWPRYAGLEPERG
ncbi:MAG TPA: GFA family protein [Burkholderiaceae bacterium]|nr:GFA family protein [Burkholderiaceae bacterium]